MNAITSYASALTPRIRALDNFVGTASSQVRQGSVDHPLFENLGHFSGVAREIAPSVPESRHFARVQGALDEASKMTDRSSAFRTAILEARRVLDDALTSIGHGPHLAQRDSVDGTAALRSAGDTPHFDTQGLDELGNVARGADRGHVGNDGQGFTELSDAAGARAHDDFSDIVLF